MKRDLVIKYIFFAVIRLVKDNITTDYIIYIKYFIYMYLHKNAYILVLAMRLFSFSNGYCDLPCDSFYGFIRRFNGHIICSTYRNYMLYNIVSNIFEKLLRFYLFLIFSSTLEH